jgi:hypothetical protein
VFVVFVATTGKKVKKKRLPKGAALKKKNTVKTEREREKTHVSPNKISPVILHH